MASFTKREGAWRAQVKVGGQRCSESFPTRAQAVAWAAKKETELRAVQANRTGERPAFVPRTLGDLVAEYASKESPKKAGARWEELRLAAIGRDKELAPVQLRDLTAAHLAAWRDRRALEVSAASVRREMNLLGHALNVAAAEWGWLPASPMRGMRRPAEPAARDRRVTLEELEKILFTSGYRAGEPALTVAARVGAAFAWAIETAMRAGEIASLTWGDVDQARSVARVHRGKTAAARRQVPLTPAALAILEQLRAHQDAAGRVFGLGAPQIDAHFRKLRNRAGIVGLHFHDSRHEAITRLAQRIDVLDLARMVGHASLDQLMTYYNRGADELARQLAAPIAPATARAAPDPTPTHQELAT